MGRPSIKVTNETDASDEGEKIRCGNSHFQPAVMILLRIDVSMERSAPQKGAPHSSPFHKGYTTLALSLLSSLAA